VILGGERLDADLIVAGVGVGPAAALAERSELHVDNAIVVDTYLETAPPGVFAIGDAARWPDPRAGGLVRIKHWMLAHRQGEAVARTIVDERAPFTYAACFWSQYTAFRSTRWAMPSAGRRSRSTGTSSSTMAWCTSRRGAGRRRGEPFPRPGEPRGRTGHGTRRDFGVIKRPVHEGRRGNDPSVSGRRRSEGSTRAEAQKRRRPRRIPAFGRSRALPS
jgi:hypothetical protein